MEDQSIPTTISVSKDEKKQYQELKVEGLITEPFSKFVHGAIYDKFTNIKQKQKKE